MAPAALSLLAAAGTTVALDQLTKLAAVRSLSAGRVPLAGPWLGLRQGLNRSGGALGLSDRTAVAVGVGVLACLGILFAIAAPPPAMLQSIGLGLLVGGAAGNLVDRLARGGVVDFIELRWWPTFNVADAAMVVGTALVAWTLL